MKEKTCYIVAIQNKYFNKLRLMKPAD